jgi:hypothetical protein
MSYRPSLLLMPVLFLAACSSDPPAAGTTSAPAATTAAPAPSMTAASSASSTAAAAPASAAPAGAPASQASSPEPSVEEWEAAAIDLGILGNWDATGCVARRIREWVRVGCSTSKSKSGAPVSIQIVKGFAMSKLSILTERSGATMLVFPAKAGLDAEASFNFADASFRFVVRWPEGQPEPKPLGSFERVDTPAKPSGTPALSNDPLPEEPAVEGAPAAKEWATAREVGVKGSSALGCETRQSGEWFRMVCRSNDNTGKAKSATAIQGFDPKTGYLVTGNGALIVLTRYVKGSDIAIDLSWERTYARLNLLWPKDMARTPAVQGEIVPRL